MRIGKLARPPVFEAKFLFPNEKNLEICQFPNLDNYKNF